MNERGVQFVKGCFAFYIIGKALTSALPKDIIRLLNANSLLVMGLCAYFGGFANWLGRHT